VRRLPALFPLNKRLRPWIGGVGIASGALLFLAQQCAPPAPVLIVASVVLVCAQVIAAVLLFPRSSRMKGTPLRFGEARTRLRRVRGGEVVF
jgi:hypothetical protein